MCLCHKGNQSRVKFSKQNELCKIIAITKPLVLVVENIQGWFELHGIFVFILI